MHLLHPEADIHLNHLMQNYLTIKKMVGAAKVMAVVKANAYGHGAVPIAHVLSDVGVLGFCVALAKEAEELIAADISEPILHLGRISASSINLYQSGQVRCSINSVEDINILEEYGSEKAPFIAHLKIDTGMGRLGIKMDNDYSILQKLAESKSIRVEAVYSHFATADENDTQYRDWQLDQFRKVIKLANDILPDTNYFHIANSAGILNCPESHFNMVRPGISLYGVSPMGMPHNKLKPVMKMKAPVILLKKMKAGDSVGYNRLYIAEKNETIAILQAGYADGIPTDFSNSGGVELNGCIYPMIGKVSMDLIAINCGEDTINEGDEAVIWGGDHENNQLEYISKKYSKIPYEFLTGVSARVKRNLINE